MGIKKQIRAQDDWALIPYECLKEEFKQLYLTILIDVKGIYIAYESTKDKKITTRNNISLLAVR